MQFILFEDDGYQNLLPLTYFRPSWELRCGAKTLCEKVEQALGTRCFKVARSYLQKWYLPAEDTASKAKLEADVILINGRWILEAGDESVVRELLVNQALVDGETLLACRVATQDLPEHVSAESLDLEQIQARCRTVAHAARMVKYPWDAVSWNGDEIKRDFARLHDETSRGGRGWAGVHVLAADQVFVAEDATIDPGVILDARHGPIWIDSGAIIMANSVLEGPVYVGQRSTIKIAAKIYENTTIGPVSKVGGEVEASIIQGYSNKQHDGFLGHAFLGSWVNLGADTNNSDLKNNYGNITVFVNGEAVDTGQRFVGLTMGDHSKCAINTAFNTGTVVGVSSNIFGAGMPPKFVPSFAWGGSEGFAAYDFEKSVAVAKTVMSRRKIGFEAAERSVFEAVHQLAAATEKGFIE